MTKRSLNILRVLLDLLKYSISAYPALLLINSPLAIFIFIGRLSFIFYVFFLFPYLQAVSILYVHHYSNGDQWKLSDLFKFAFTRFPQLLIGHLLVIFSLSAVFIIFSLASSLVAFILLVIMEILGSSIDPIARLLLLFVGVLAIGGIAGLFCYSKLLLVPHLIAIERYNATDSFIETLRLTKDNRIRIFLILLAFLLGGFLPVIYISLNPLLVGIFIFKQQIYAAAGGFMLCQPLIFIYSFVVYKHLKGGAKAAD
ncbi:MAG: hypothetical protein F6K30_17895 [Cyanothece sp. SIO2G6]|nr:hypothetical protein [Cyanothece sp. SIO2G6]